ncbi:undecaprenyl-phosphate alpha-N-acetylglucosaminyl 1-phosphate transferase, partial [Salmonella enterica subsp. enterica serovar Typhimurium]
PNTISTWPIVLGATIIVITGVIDDMKELSAKAKMGGQIHAALVTVLGGLQIEFITIPGGNVIEFGVLAAPLTMLWIVAIINGINFLDGLDGLAAGVSSIVLLTFSVLGILMG